MTEYMAFIWLGFALFMLICEIVTVQLVSIWFVFGGIAAAISCVFTDNIFIQAVVFIVVSALCLILTRPFVKKVTKNKIEHTNADKLIGRIGIVTTDIVNSQGVGQVNIDGQIWSAKSVDNVDVKAGASVKIQSIQGVKLLVEVI